MQYYQNGEFKIVYVVYEYSYMYKDGCLGVFENVEDALNVKQSNCRIEVELRSVDDNT